MRDISSPQAVSNGAPGTATWIEAEDVRSQCAQHQRTDAEIVGHPAVAGEVETVHEIRLQLRRQSTGLEEGAGQPPWAPRAERIEYVMGDRRAKAREIAARELTLHPDQSDVVTPFRDPVRPALRVDRPPVGAEREPHRCAAQASRSAAQTPSTSDSVIFGCRGNVSTRSAISSATGRVSPSLR